MEKTSKNLKQPQKLSENFSTRDVVVSKIPLPQECPLRSLHVPQLKCTAPPGSGLRSSGHNIVFLKVQRWQKEIKFEKKIWSGKI